MAVAQEQYNAEAELLKNVLHFDEELISALAEIDARDKYNLALQKIQRVTSDIELIRGLIDWLDLLVRTNSDFTPDEHSIVNGLRFIKYKSLGKFSMARA